MRIRTGSMVVAVSLGLQAFAGDALSVAAPVDEGRGNVNFFLGAKKLNSDDWAALDDQTELGVEVDFGRRGWPVHIAVDLLNSGHTEGNGPGEETARTGELDVGVRKGWVRGRIHLYAGGGVAVLTAQERIGSGPFFGDEDAAVGGWAGGGVFWRLKERFNIGLSLRYSKGRVELFGVDREAGGPHGGLTLGWGW